MKKKISSILKIVFGLTIVANVIYNTVSSYPNVDFFGYFVLIIAFPSVSALFLASGLLIIDGILGLDNIEVPAIVYRNVALCMLFFGLNSLLLTNATDKQQFNKWYFIVDRTIIPFIFVGYYFLFCKEKKFDMENFFGGFVLSGLYFFYITFLIGLQIGVLYIDLFIEPIFANIHTSDFYIVDIIFYIFLIIVSNVFANLILLGLNRFKFKITKKPNDSFENYRKTKRLFNRN